MKVVFRTNLGMVDAKTLGLDYTACKLGSTVDVSDDVGARLLKAGIALTEADAKKDAILVSHREEAAKQAEVKGEDKTPAITAPAK